ncbi:MAG: fibronectin type III domain-containing protein [Planctomycetes bacterium]|nr:fibronectin type III domain-containing protein [Planctomycetota bacterium]
MTESGQAFTRTPSALRVSSGSTKLWAINSAATPDTVFSYTDDLVGAGPTLSGPSDGKEVQVNPVSGGTFTVPLSWERPSKADSYNVQVALDSSFSEKVVSLTGSTSVDGDSATMSSVQSGDNFMPDTTYYWRVRVASDGPIYSPWSAVRSFSIGSLPDVAAPIVIEPAAPAPAPEVVIEAPVITIQPPEIVIPPAPAPAAAPEIVIPAAPAAPAPITPGFIWAIVIIGAVLIIALIILIIRTRRPV